MQILDEKGLSGMVKRLLDLIFLGGAAVILGLPFFVKWYADLMHEATSFWFLLPFLYVTGLLAFLIVYEIRRIFKTLNRRNPFKMDNVNSLKRMAFASFGIAAAYVVKIILFNSFLTIVLAMAFVIVGLFCIILAEVFHQAVTVKEENDLTV